MTVPPVPPVPLVCLIATWRDEQLLADAVHSAAPHVDAVVVLDGAYVGVIEQGRGVATSHGWELAAAEMAGATVFQTPPWYWWPGEIEKRNVLLELGRAVAGATSYAALVLDADELLVNGEHLRSTLFAKAGLPRREPDGRVWWASSRLFFVDECTRYVERSYWLQSCTALRVSLEHREMDLVDFNPGAPFVEHRWRDRSPWRLEVQQWWGRDLARRDHGG